MAYSSTPSPSPAEFAERMGGRDDWSGHPSDCTCRQCTHDYEDGFRYQPTPPKISQTVEVDNILTLIQTIHAIRRDLEAAGCQLEVFRTGSMRLTKGEKGAPTATDVGLNVDVDARGAEFRVAQRKTDEITWQILLKALAEIANIGQCAVSDLNISKPEIIKVTAPAEGAEGKERFLQAMRTFAAKHKAEPEAWTSEKAG